jgi:O-antigen/teichoic acid export membrane protein
MAGPAGSAPLSTRLLAGAALMVGLRFAVRALGLVSVIILARLLTPADFGVIGTAALVIGLFAILQNIGVWDGLTRLREIDDSHVCTAWTCNLIVCGVVSATLVAITPLAIRVLEEPKLATVLPLLAIVPVLTALASPGSAVLLRNLEFRREFQLRVLQKVLAVAATVLAAMYYGDYRGLVAGSLIGAAGFVLLTYLLFPYRPRLTLSRWRDFAGFSFWTLVQGGAVYVATAVDEFIVRRMTTTAVFGLYHASRDVSRALVAEMVAPAATALLPGLVRLRDERERFARAAERAVGVGAIVAIACGIGVAATAVEVAALLLGPQWGGVAPFLAWSAIGVAAQTLSGLHRSILAALDRQHWSSLLWVLRAAVIALACSLAGTTGEPLRVVQAFALASIALTLFDYALILWLLGRPAGLLRIFARPLLAGAAMLGVLSLLAPPPAWPLLLVALVKVGTGALTYALTLAALWFALGRPAGAESALLERLPERFGRRLLPARGAAP